MLAFLDRRDVKHDLVYAWMQAQEQELVTTPLVVAELDYLISTRSDERGTRILREDFDRGAYLVEWWPTAIHETVAIARRYESMELGLTDASLIALAARLQTTTIATLDERHFRAVKPVYGGDAFTLLPTDEASDGYSDAVFS